MSESLPANASPSGPPALPLGRRLRYLLEAGGFFLVMGFFRLFKIDRASAIGGWIGRRLVAPTFLSRRALGNLRAAYPEKSEAEIGAILRSMWDNLGRVMAEYTHLQEIRWKDAKPRVEVTGLEHLEALKAAGKGWLLFSGHLANWEIMPFIAHEYGIAGGMILRPPNNPYVNRWFEAVRAKSGMESIAKGAQGTRRAFTLLRKGDALLLLVDQRASEGIPVPFFGRDAFTTSAPAALALKLGAVLVPVSNERVNGAHFRLRVHPPIPPPNTGDDGRDLVELTASITRFIEERVRERPGEWLWIHKRWQGEGAALRERAQARALRSSSVTGASENG